MLNDFPNIQTPAEIKAKSISELEDLAEACREQIIYYVSRNGGHLASNLGVVELTLALAKVFNFESGQDRIIFDVGHQVYTWKLITGRSQDFTYLRQKDGLSGFPKREESSYDFYNAGHSSTSISIALGYQRADQLNGEKRQNIALVGDGALTGGMSFEALNDAGQGQDPIKIILNDNQMSIDANVGGLAKHLDHIRVSKSYLELKKQVDSNLSKLPRQAKGLKAWLSKIKSRLRTRLHKDSLLFENLGFRYYGPIDGHNLEELINYLEAVKESDKPTILHVITKKGHGYKPAENEPARFHGVAPFEVEDQSNKTQSTSSKEVKAKSFSNYVSDNLLRLAEASEDVCAITAAMAQGTGLSAFAASHPDRFFDTGIAEQHAVGLGAGLALAGKKPFVALYSTFSQRAVDQILHDVCLQKLPVCFLLDRAGLVSADGETHQGLYDSAIFGRFPNLKLYAPADAKDLELLMTKALTSDGPIMIRYPKADALAEIEMESRDLDGLRCLRLGKQISIIAYGAMAENCLEAGDLLAEEGIFVSIYSAISGNNIQISDNINRIKQDSLIVVVEEGISQTGFSGHIEAKFQESQITSERLHLSVSNGIHGQASRNELLDEEGLSPQKIASSILEAIRD